MLSWSELTTKNIKPTTKSLMITETNKQKQKKNLQVIWLHPTKLYCLCQAGTLSFVENFTDE